MALTHFRDSKTPELFLSYIHAKKNERKKIKEKIYEIELPLIREELSQINNFEDQILKANITYLSTLQNICNIIMNTAASYKKMERNIRFYSINDRKLFADLTNVNIDIFLDFERVDRNKLN